MTIAWLRLIEAVREQDGGGAAPAAAVAAATTTAAPAAETVSDRAALAGLFAAELERESEAKSTPAVPAAAAETNEIPAEGNAATTEQEDAPADTSGTSAEPAIDAPSGMSEADRALWAQLSPEMRSWVSKREQEARADYTRKTQEVAERRRQSDAIAQQLQGQMQQYDQILAQITNRNIAPPNPALRMSDPLAYDEQMATYLHQRHIQEQAHVERQRVAGEQAQIQQRQQQEFERVERERLAQLDPEMADPQKGVELRRQVHAYGIKAGYSAEQLGMASATDMVTLRKAMAWDAAQAARANAKPVPQAVPKSSTPTAAKTAPNKGSLAAAVVNLSQSGTRESLAAAYKAQLDSER